MATLSGVGLARFAYTALMPQMVHAGWFSGEQVAYLGAANLLGYLIGALAAAPLAERMGALRVLLICWVAVALSFAGCSLPQPMGVFFVWRLISGVAGAVLMVLGPSVAMAAAEPFASLDPRPADVLRHWRGRAAGGHAGAHVCAHQPERCLVVADGAVCAGTVDRLARSAPDSLACTRGSNTGARGRCTHHIFVERRRGAGLYGLYLRCVWLCAAHRVLGGLSGP